MVKNNKGFSLVDVVCAMAILALVALPICSGFLTAAKSNQRIRERTEITTLLNNELSKIIATGEVVVRQTEDPENGEGPENTQVPQTELTVDLLSLTPLSQGAYSYTKTLSEKSVDIILKPKASISDPENKVAYVEVTLIYNNGTEDDTADDYSVTGVWAG